MAAWATAQAKVVAATILALSQGTGELTFEGADSYAGAIQATSQGMNMTIKLAGKKVGTCDNPQ